MKRWEAHDLIATTCVPEASRILAEMVGSPPYPEWLLEFAINALEESERQAMWIHFPFDDETEVDESTIRATYVLHFDGLLRRFVERRDDGPLSQSGPLH